MTDDYSSEPVSWFIISPFLTKRSGRILVAIARIFRLDRGAELASSQDFFQVTLDKESAKMLMEMLHEPPRNSEQPMYSWLTSGLREFTVDEE